tara:strand:+ start:2068 stop:2448 length:381 start_codon:yes stop_codon:yes gene_type:complete
MSALPKCTCKTKNPNITSKFHETEVDEEGICIHCGHYAVWDSDYDLFPKSYFGIHGYKQVSRNHVPGWTSADIETYFSYVTDDHDNFKIISGNEELDYGGIGTGSRRSRRKKERVINTNFNKRTHL